MHYLPFLFFISVLISCGNEKTITNIAKDSAVAIVDSPLEQPLDTTKMVTAVKETIDASIKGLLVGTHPLPLQLIS